VTIQQVRIIIRKSFAIQAMLTFNYLWTPGYNIQKIVDKHSSKQVKLTSMLTIIVSGLIHPIIVTGWQAVMVDYTKPGMPHQTGSASKIYPLPSFIKLLLITTNHSTIFMVVHKTTTALVARHEQLIVRGSSIPIGI